MSRKSMRTTISIACVLCTLGATGGSTASGDIWRDVDPAVQLTGQEDRVIRPAVFRLVALDRAGLEMLLSQAPMELTAAAGNGTVELPLPMPNGSIERFRIEEAPIMAPELARRFPQIRTYRGQGIDDPTATLRFDLTPAGFHAQILRAGDSVYIDPLWRGEARFYQSYLKGGLRKNPAEPPFICHLQDPPSDHPGDSRVDAHDPPATPSGRTLRTYRLALAGTGEYTAAVCSPNPAGVACGLAAMVTSMNRVNGVYEREVAIRMVMVGNNDQIVYTDGTKDPYTNGNGSTMLGENQTNLDAVIGGANYDIGHVFSTGGGGVAYVGVPCQAGMKARGVTGRAMPVGDPFDIDYVAHEMGHQWGGLHTFNGTTGSCSGNRSSSAAYEPGSGSTIMAYAGICGAENLQPNSDDIFHTKSFDQIIAYSTGNGDSCAQKTATGNNPPSVNPGTGFTVPKQTPFTLTGAASDPDGDALTYLWEEYDLGASSPPQGDSDAARPIFRTFTASAGPSRTFPRLADILAGTQTFGEWMPSRTRVMSFRLTVRDNRSGGGGVDRAATTVNVNASAGPFVVTQPTTGTTWAGGAAGTVTWNVANTTASPVSCSAVDITLSTDGGNTFSTTLAGNTANDGSQSVSVPAITTSSARVKVACRGNIFFAVSRPNFSIACTAPTAFPLTLPLAGASLGGNVVTLDWSASSGATAYDVYLGTTTTPPLLQTVASPGLDVPVSPGQTYYWRVVARNSCGQASAPGSGTRSFTVLAPVLESASPPEVDLYTTAGATGNLNGILEPGETFVLAPRWRNAGNAAAAFTARASDLGGPPGSVYTLLDDGAAYGTLAAGATTTCQAAGGDCYLVGVSSPEVRPALHWDATVLETLSTGETHTLTLHVGRSFTDVQPDDKGLPFIETLLHNRVTAGCGNNRYCPGATVTRWQMALFLTKSILGPNGIVPTTGSVGADAFDCSPGGHSLFDDVEPTDPGCPFIHFIYGRGITVGCGNGHYCPLAQVTRWQMAVFLAKSMVGPGGTIPIAGEVEGHPYNCSDLGASLFGDVAPTDGGCPSIHYIFKYRVTAGCGNDRYCPGAPTTRWQMAVFLTLAFGLQLY